MRHIVVGVGQIGSAILECLHLHGGCAAGVDIGDAYDGTCEYLHICFPGDLADFESAVCAYIERFRPIVCIIHSTVMPGTTDTIQDHCACLMAYSPVRGRHGRLVEDLHDFTKFVGAPLIEAAHAAAAGLLEAGFRVEVAKDAISLEIGKLFQTTYTGVLVAWAQEMKRYCDAVGADFMQAQMMCEMPNLPHVVHQPGFIGGHCIISNLEILDRIMSGLFTEAIRVSNKATNENFSGGRLWPIPFRQDK